MPARIDRRQVSRRGFVEVMATKQPALADGPRWDPLSRLASACRRSSADIQPGTARPDWDHSHSICDRTNLIGTKRFLNLVAGNRLVFTHANPGRERVALAALGKFIGQALADLRSARGDR
jgi:hypothetical protein